MVKETAAREQTEPASATVTCCLFTVMCYLHRCFREALSSTADRRRGERHVADADLDKEAALNRRTNAPATSSENDVQDEHRSSIFKSPFCEIKHV